MIQAKKYIEDVINDNILVCKNIKMSIEKHLYLLEHSEEKGIYFDEDAAAEAIDTFKRFRHTKGDAAKALFQLLGWQEFILYYTFGWKVKATKKRLVRTVYVEVPKKNGKTEYAGGVGNLMTFFDGENGAETYIAAKVEKQAKICFNVMAEMVKMMRMESASVRRTIPAPNSTRIFSHESNSFVTFLSKDSLSAEGINTHCGIVDELHAHKDGSQVENIETSMVARSQPLLFIITTAGSSLGSYCYQYRNSCIDVLKGIKEDDTLLSMIYTLDDEYLEGDKWEDPNLWPMANPSLGIVGGVSLENLISSCQAAKNLGVSKLNYWKTRHLNFWVSSISSWVTDEKWKKLQKPIDWKGLQNRLAFGGLDLSSKFDLSAWAVLIPPIEDGEPFKFKITLYLPEDNIENLEREHKAPYRDWAAKGLITLTPGNVIDYAYIRKDILKDSEYFDLQGTGYDRKFSTRIVSDLTDDGLELNPLSQTTTVMNAPITEIESLIELGLIEYDISPIVRWMMSNVALYTDTDGYKKVNRNKSGKVDGIVGLLMSFAQYLIWRAKGGDTSAYKSSEIFYV